MPLSKPFSEPVSDRTPKRERRKESRPGELLVAALDLFVEKGFAATRMEEVAARAGVSKGTVFLYFPSKEDLFKAVVRENISGRFEEWNAEFLRYEGSSADMLHHCMTTWWHRIGSTQASGISKLMISEGGHFPDIVEFYQTEVVQPGHALIRQVLQRGIDRGEFCAVNLDFAVYGVVAAMMFLILSKHSAACLQGNVSLDPDAYIANQVAVMLHGLCTSKPLKNTVLSR
jgi:TetR/AcrR family transcriptional regulator